MVNRIGNYYLRIYCTKEPDDNDKCVLNIHKNRNEHACVFSRKSYKVVDLTQFLAYPNDNYSYLR